MPATLTPNCLHDGDFALYLNGSPKPYGKTRMEKHLNVCTHCFERFLFAFNRHLDAISGGKAKKPVRREIHEESKRRTRL